jgi:hypothetical protein
MYLTLPFSLPLEYLAPLGFTVFVLVTTAIAASFWAVAVYVVAAGVLLLRRG